MLAISNFFTGFNRHFLACIRTPDFTAAIAHELPSLHAQTLGIQHELLTPAQAEAAILRYIQPHLRLFI